jgi:hypothetical protein
VVDRRGEDNGRGLGGPAASKAKTRKAETRHRVLINRISKIHLMKSPLFSSQSLLPSGSNLSSWGTNRGDWLRHPLLELAQKVVFILPKPHFITNFE